jgi:hypothetical protein
MASASRVVSVGTAATLLWQTTSGVSPDPAVSVSTGIFWAGTPADPRPILVRNTGSSTVYLGGPGVTTATGMELLTGESIPYNSVGNDSLYAVVASSTDNVTVEAQRI